MAGAIGTILNRMVPKWEFRNSTTLATTNAYLYHIGLAIIVVGHLPHISFITA